MDVFDIITLPFWFPWAFFGIFCFLTAQFGASTISSITLFTPLAMWFFISIPLCYNWHLFQYNFREEFVSGLITHALSFLLASCLVSFVWLFIRSHPDSVTALVPTNPAIDQPTSTLDSAVQRAMQDRIASLEAMNAELSTQVDALNVAAEKSAGGYAVDLEDKDALIASLREFPPSSEPLRHENELLKQQAEKALADFHSMEKELEKIKKELGKVKKLEIVSSAPVSFDLTALTLSRL